MNEQTRDPIKARLNVAQVGGKRLQAWRLDKLVPITEQEANDIARTACLEYPTDYNQGEHFQPHAWVTAAIMRASARQPDPNDGRWDTLDGISGLGCEAHLYRVHPDDQPVAQVEPMLEDVLAMIDSRAGRLANDAANRIAHQLANAVEFEGIDMVPDAAGHAMTALRDALVPALKDKFARRLVVTLASTSR